MYDIVIIGAGPAGLTAAIYGARANKKVLILESQSYGGQIITSPEIANYPGLPNVSGFDFATNLYNQVKDMGVEVKYETVEKIVDKNTIKTNKSEYKTHTIIIATGLKRRALGLYGEKELVGSGVSYCATCDGNFYKDKDVAVVGGGNTAIEDAIYLSKICKKVYLIHRRDSFRAEESSINILKETKNVEIIYNSAVTELIGNNKLEAINVQNIETLNDHKLPVSALFVAIGFQPENKFAKDLVELDEYEYIVSDETCQTSIDNIFVAGDCRTKILRQLTTSVSDGAIAATNAVKHLNNL